MSTPKYLPECEIFDDSLTTCLEGSAIVIHVMENEQEILELMAGEVYQQRKFGPNTVNRGALLFSCEWDGGRFERGAFISGMFRSGEFAGGLFMGGIFWDGTWADGVWEGGFDRSGAYRPRGNSPTQW